jgi:ketosteroid isomerase-like protein
MKRTLPPLLLLLAAVSLSMKATAFQTQNDHAKDLDALVQTERDFARAAAAKGTRAAFLAFLADDGIVFAPGPVNGKKSWEARPSRPGLLAWEPIYADISAAGDLGYTTGPWEFRPKGADDKPVAFGNFMTIWKRQADGTFKFMLDLGVSNPQPATTQALQVSQTQPKAVRKSSEADLAALRESLLGVEREFSKTVADKGALKAYTSYTADDVRVLREGKAPFVGKQAALASLGSGDGVKFTWQPAKSDIASSADMGYTYGTYEWKAADEKQNESGNYVHIWKRQLGGKWRLVMEVLNPTPKKTS